MMLTSILSKIFLLQEFLKHPIRFHTRVFATHSRKAFIKDYKSKSTESK